MLPASEPPSIQPTPTYVPDDANAFFGELQQLIAQAADGKPLAAEDFYALLGQTLRRAAEQKTRFNGLTLGGLHAKVDFLCKECGAEPSLRRAVNVARRHILQPPVARTDEAALRLADVRAVARFIACICQAEIPAKLLCRLPLAAAAPPAPQTVLGAVMRVVAERWDEAYIYVRCDAIGNGQGRVRLHTAQADWTYLLKLLTPDVQLNLVRPTLADGAIEAELIILEPDYLVDVTSVSRCFETFSHSPFLSLLKRLEPFRTSKEILLGNLAGQLLDNEVYGAVQTPDAVFDAFVRENLTDILALEQEGRLDMETLRTESLQQAANIRTALRQSLVEHVGSYVPSLVMLEPSFFSEMLGLQGRMDFLQLDHRVLIEQKSGKGGYHPALRDPSQPIQKEPHYVQMLLYRAILRYNFPEQYAANHHDLRTFLLYSRYARPLLGLGQASALLHEAFRVRNGIVWYEQYYCNGGARILERITPESLNQLHAHGRLWEAYTRPQLQAMLAPIQTATPLERAYFFRMLRFVAHEHRIAKVGDNTAQTNCFASKWYASLAEKRESGEIYDGLLLDVPPEGKPVGSLNFRFSGRGDAGAPGMDTTNFRRGDIIVCYPYDAGSTPDCRRTHVFRGSLTEITPEGVQCRLAAAQGDGRVFRHDAHRLWAVEHDLYESAFTSLYAALHAFLRTAKPRRDLLLLQRPPRIDETVRLKGDYGAFNAMALRVKQASDFFLIIGPPGTGKTSYGLLNTLREELLEPDSRILLLSYTNRAVDEICSKLVEMGLDFLRIGSAESCELAYRPYLLEERLQGQSAEAGRQLFRTARIVAGTTTSLSRKHSLFVLMNFSLAIIDEASQILEPHLLGLLSMMHGGQPAIRKFVFIGDHKQLPAVVQQPAAASAADEPALHDIGLYDCRSSLFERLLRRYGDDPRLTFMLTRQGRMHPDIADFPSREFYEGRLDVVPLRHQLAASLPADPRLRFIAVRPAAADLRVASPKVNLAEARVIAREVAKAYRRSPADFRAESTLGIIVPYRNQIAALRTALATLCREEHLPDALRMVTIDTVERYQGSQRDVIIFGFTISRPYQLEFLAGNVFEENGHAIDRKLNVAMTRARTHLLLVGNPDILCRNLVYSHLLRYIRQQGGYEE